SPDDRLDRQMAGVLTIDLDVTPKANTLLVGSIVVALIVALLFVIWAVMYGINRLVSRIPDPSRQNVRFAEFSCRVHQLEGGSLRLELVAPPSDAELKKPRRTPAELRAGPLRILRLAPLAPWKVPSAVASMATERFLEDLGRGVTRQAVPGERRVRAQPSDASGPLTA